jgi:hypothetical protein
METRSQRNLNIMSRNLNEIVCHVFWLLLKFGVAFCDFVYQLSILQTQNSVTEKSSNKSQNNEAWRKPQRNLGKLIFFR